MCTCVGFIIAKRVIIRYSFPEGMGLELSKPPTAPFMIPHETDAQPRVLEIALLGNPVLRRETDHVVTPLDAKVRALIANMIATINHHGAVGLAAPQVSESLRLIIVASKSNPVYPDAPTIEPIVMVNPRIEDRSHQIVRGWEGCASIPGIRAKIDRHERIRVSYFDADGVFHKETFEGFIARIIQHEYDHINGINFVDHQMHDVMMHSEFMKRVIGSTQNP